MKQVFVILWLGQPYVFGSYDRAKSWLLDKLPDLSDLEVRFSIYSRELIDYEVR